MTNSRPNKKGRPCNDGRHSSPTQLLRPPGPQSPSTARLYEGPEYFLTEDLWKAAKDRGDFDYIVVGSGITGLAFVKEVLSTNPHAKVLLMERGPFFLQEHFQMLPLPYKFTLGGASETFPWTLVEHDKQEPGQYIQLCHGSCPFFGGRSLFWSAWCPKTDEPNLIHDWPAYMKETLSSRKLWDKTSTLLNITNANRIGDDLYRRLQYELEERLEGNIGLVGSANGFNSAPMAVGNVATIGQKFDKFSTPAPFLSLQQRQNELEKLGLGSKLSMVLDCVVEELVNDGSKVSTIKTSRGEVKVGDAKVVLCTGCVPATTLLLNSFPNNNAIQQRAGSRLTGHFISHFTARVKRESFRALTPGLELAAIYIPGRGSPTPENPLGPQYHIQVTAIANTNPSRYSSDASRECPDYAASATAAQLDGSEGHVLFVCAALGEMRTGKDSWVKFDPASNDKTTNVKLKVTMSEADLKLWDEMDQAVQEAITAMCTNAADNSCMDIEYWHDIDQVAHANKAKKWRIKGVAPAGSWEKDPPPPHKAREPALVHEASTIWMGEGEEDSVVGKDYRPHGVENVYITGSGLFPSSGSWNPTPTIVALAQNLAENLTASSSVQPRSLIPASYKWKISMDASADGF